MGDCHPIIAGRTGLINRLKGQRLREVMGGVGRTGPDCLGGENLDHPPTRLNRIVLIES